MAGKDKGATRKDAAAACKRPFVHWPSRESWLSGLFPEKAKAVFAPAGQIGPPQEAVLCPARHSNCV